MTNISCISRLKFSALIDMGDSGYSPYTFIIIGSSRENTQWIFSILHPCRLVRYFF